MQHFPAGTSKKNLLHWLQMYETGEFKDYDYGTKHNKQIYGTATPPAWDLSKIKFPVHLFAGDYDMLADPTDVQRLYDELTNS